MSWFSLGLTFDTWNQLLLYSHNQVDNIPTTTTPSDTTTHSLSTLEWHERSVTTTLKLWQDFLSDNLFIFEIPKYVGSYWHCGKGRVLARYQRVTGVLFRYEESDQRSRDTPDRDEKRGSGEWVVKTCRDSGPYLSKSKVSEVSPTREIFVKRGVKW